MPEHSVATVSWGLNLGAFTVCVGPGSPRRQLCKPRSHAMKNIWHKYVRWMNQAGEGRQWWAQGHACSGANAGEGAVWSSAWCLARCVTQTSPRGGTVRPRATESPALLCKIYAALYNRRGCVISKGNGIGLEGIINGKLPLKIFFKSKAWWWVSKIVISFKMLSFTLEDEKYVLKKTFSI